MVSLKVKTNDSNYEPTLYRILYNATCEAANDYPESAYALRSFGGFMESNPCFVSHTIGRYIESREAQLHQELVHAEIAAQGGY